jgi:hypothetical protein
MTDLAWTHMLSARVAKSPNLATSPAIWTGFGLPSLKKCLTGFGDLLSRLGDFKYAGEHPHTWRATAAPDGSISWWDLVTRTGKHSPSVLKMYQPYQQKCSHTYHTKAVFSKISNKTLLLEVDTCSVFPLSMHPAATRIDASEKRNWFKHPIKESILISSSILTWRLSNSNYDEVS